MNNLLKKSLLLGFIGIASLLLMAGCASKQAEGQSVSLIDDEVDAPDSMKTGPGLFSREDGEFVIYRK